MPAFPTSHHLWLVVRLQGRSLQSNYFSFDETSAAYIQARFEAIRGRKGRGSVRIRCLIVDRVNEAVLMSSFRLNGVNALRYLA